jgi:hypothetical protein
MSNEAQIKDRPLTDNELEEVAGGALAARGIATQPRLVNPPAGLLDAEDPEQCKETSDSGAGCGTTGDG